MTRILSLDDNVDLLSILSNVLEAAGYEVLTTTDSYEAWAVLHTSLDAGEFPASRAHYTATSAASKGRGSKAHPRTKVMQ